MVAQYKRKRHLEDMSNDGPPKHLNLEGAERQRGKREVVEGLEDTKDLNEFLAELKADDEENYEKDYECYLKSKADPNYVCTCFKLKNHEKLIL